VGQVNVARVIMKAIEYSFDQLEREAKRLGPLKLPSNARTAEEDRERFESKIADAFVAGMRNTDARQSRQRRTLVDSQEACGEGGGESVLRSGFALFRVGFLVGVYRSVQLQEHSRSPGPYLS
jgi:hypothetical protein